MTKIKGFSTIELLIAFSVLTVSLTAVILVAFGNQTYAVDTELAQRALYIAEEKLEQKVAEALDDFENVTNETDAVGRYSTAVIVSDVSECLKRIDSTVSWQQGLRNLDTILTSTVVNTDTSLALAHDCASEEPEDDWDNPAIFVDENVTGQSDATSLDEFDHFVYLTTDPAAANKDDFFIYEFDEVAVTLTARDTFNTSLGYNAGLNDVDVAGDYAFLASASSSHQLQILDISDPDNITLLWETALPGVDPDGSYPAAISIYYLNNRVYLGTAETDGPEFHIFDVSNVGINPPTHLGSLELTHNVNEIVVKNDLAYLATSDNNRELMIIDVSNPASLTHPDITGLGFDADGNNDGESIYVGNNRVYLGRAQNNPPTDSFYILDRADTLNNSSATDGILGQHSIGLQNNTYIAGIRVSGDLAFLSIDDPNQGLIIYNITDPINIVLPAACSEFNYSENTVALDSDIDSKYLFAANSSNAEISIIHDLDAVCPL